MPFMPEVLALFALDALFLFFATIAFFLSLKIVYGWSGASTTKRQYHLEKISYLGAVIVRFIFSIKVPLFLFFIFTLDKISGVIVGAMCAAGVVDATSIGSSLMALKILNLYLFAYWLFLHSYDSQTKEQVYIREKFALFLLFYLFLVVEIVLEIYMFLNIKIDKMVSCCSGLYSQSSLSGVSSLFALDSVWFYGSLYLIFLLMIVGFVLKKRLFFALLNVLFVPVALIGLIMFFGTYIYELPSHHCPFCILQQEYYFVGYFLYTFLFLGTFYGIVLAFKREFKPHFGISLFFNSLFVAVVSYFVLVYYFRNGVLL